jgi:hypothetical protein
MALKMGTGFGTDASTGEGSTLTALTFWSKTKTKCLRIKQKAQGNVNVYSFNTTVWTTLCNHCGPSYF